MNNGVWKWISGLLASILITILLGWFTVVKDIPDMESFRDLKIEMKQLKKEIRTLSSELMALKLEYSLEKKLNEKNK